MAELGTKRSIVRSPSRRNTSEEPETGVTARAVVRKATPKRSFRRSAAGNMVVMALAGGLIATMALPAYAFAPGSNGTQFGATEATQETKAGAQKVTVDASAASVSIARDGFTATTSEELAASKAASEAAARVAAVTEEMATYASAYSGPSVSEYLASPAYPNFSLSSVYSVASQYQGVPYVYGGATPAGFDCSGFVMYVYAQFGISLPHSSTGQGAAGTRISLADAQPGDLVIMDGHDGFYAGNGNILHAPYEGASVRVQPIWTSDYYIVRLGI